MSGKARDLLSWKVLDALPAALYTTDPDGQITYFNQAAVELAGRTPQLGEKWCVTWRLHTPDGQPLPHDQCPMAVALKERRAVRGAEAVAERPDGTRIPFLPYPTPLFDDDGNMLGALNMLVDISSIRITEHALARRLEEQAALYRFTDRLYRAESLKQIFEAALDAIAEALQVTRSSILLLDKSGVMRFAASRGLSEGYRAAVEGHSPWTAEETDPAPICVSDIAETDESDALKATVKAEGITGLAFIPLLSGGRLVGKFMTYYDRRHDFAPTEIDLALTIARQLGFGIERKRAEEDRRMADEQRTLLINELNHRVKNTLATVQAIASQTFGGDDMVNHSKHAFESRLIALSNAHSVLTERSWESAELRQIVEQALLPHAGADRFRIDGPEIHLTSRAAVAIAMGIHELATNAVKYGSLSSSEGIVAVEWALEGPDRMLKLVWRESGGPKVSTPNRRGFGSLLIERSLAHDLAGEAEIKYAPEGVVCVFTGRRATVGYESRQR
jgi:two-component system CheB/CheR fusion protein